MPWFPFWPPRPPRCSVRPALWRALGLGAWGLLRPGRLLAQVGYSLDTLGNLTQDRFAGYDTVGAGGVPRDVNLWGTDLPIALGGLCGIIHLVFQAAAVVLAVLGLVSLMKAARGWGGGTHAARRALVMLVLAACLLAPGPLLEFLRLGWIVTRADNAAIWSCLL